jgi:hypothetical protein
MVTIGMEGDDKRRRRNDGREDEVWREGGRQRKEGRPKQRAGFYTCKSNGEPENSEQRRGTPGNAGICGAPVFWVRFWVEEDFSCFLHHFILVLCCVVLCCVVLCCVVLCCVAMSDIWECAQQGDVEGVAGHLDSGIDVNAQV